MPFTVPAVTACHPTDHQRFQVRAIFRFAQPSHELEIAGLTATIRGYNPVSPILQALAIDPEQAQA